MTTTPLQRLVSMSLSVLLTVAMLGGIHGLSQLDAGAEELAMPAVHGVQATA